ncbi:MAG: hypothetical protein M1838_003500 [Thelocarpon superellum]|nr:MAG: hypothetical protein M1838_003500 [Thelocarpon superellum]
MSPNQLGRKALETTGIGVCVGNGNVVLAGHLIRTLRTVLNSTLPIEIAFHGEQDLTQEAHDTVMALAENMSLLGLSKIFQHPSVGLYQSWALKPFDLLASRFQRVILVDADVIFMPKPDNLFETEPGLMETGTLFWHDRAIDCLMGSLRDWLKPILGD